MGLRHSSRCLLLRRKMAEADSSEVGTLWCPAPGNSGTGTFSIWLLLWWQRIWFWIVSGCVFCIIANQIVCQYCKGAVHAKKSPFPRVLQILWMICVDTCTTRASNSEHACRRFAVSVTWSALDASMYWTWLCPLSLVLKRNLHLSPALLWVYHQYRKPPVFIITKTACFNGWLSCASHSYFI